MLHLYDLNKVKIKGLKLYKDYCIESALSTGDKVLSFLYPSRLAKEVMEECYIRTKKDEFVIKETADRGDWKSVKAILNVEGLEGQVFEHFNTTEQTIEQCLTLAVAGTGWTVQVNGVTKRRTIRKTNCSTWDIIQQAKKTYLVEIEFDTINKVIKIADKLGSDKGVYFMDSLNLRNLDIQSNSYEFYTRLIAIGKNDLKVTVENFQYSAKRKTLIWKDERYTDINALTEDATAKLAEISKPYRAFGADIIDLANMSNKYSVLSYSLGDIITLIAKEKGIKEKQRIVKITEYPEEPERNSCEIANTIVTFADIQKEYQEAAETVNNITSDNGTISEGAIKVAVEQITINKADVQDLNAVRTRIGTLEVTTATITQLNAEKVRIDNLISTAATITQLNATNAKIVVLESKAASIDTLVAGNLSAANMQAGFITAESGLIANGAIKDAMILNLSADKINSGKVNTNLVTIQSASGNMLISDNTIQIKDSTKVRVQIGKDASNDYNMYVWDALGNLMFDATGLKASGIKSKIIRDDMVSDTANIQGTKLDINSVVSSINGATTLLKATKVKLDTENQTLDIAFTSLKSTVTTQGNTITSQGTSITTIQGQISSKIWQSDITTAINNIQIGGKNLLLKSGIPITTSSYIIQDYTLIEAIADGAQVTISLKGTLGIGKTYFGIYNSGGSVALVQLFPQDKGIDGVFRKTFNWKIGGTSNTFVRVYHMLSSTIVDSTIEWIKLEVGNKSTDWTPAPKEVDDQLTLINTNYSNLNQTVNSINASVSSLQTATSSLGTRMTSAEGSITTLNNSISLKVSTTNFNTYKSSNDSAVTSLAGRVTTTESSISVLQGQIALKVSQTDLESRITQTTTNLTARFSKNGINLIRNSRGYEGTRYFYLADLVDMTVYDSKHATFKARSPFETGWGLDRPVGKTNDNYWYSDFFPIESSTKYKLVVKVRLDANVSSIDVRFCGFFLEGGQLTYVADKRITTKNVITEVVVDINTPINASSGQIIIVHNGTGASGNSVAWIAEMRLFEGDVDFGWCPNVNEIYAGVTSVDENGVTVSHTINETKTNMTSEGFYLKDNLNNTIASLGMIKGVASLLVSDITSPSILKVASWLGTKSIYVAPTKTGDGSGRDVNNKCTSIRAAILNALNGCMVLNDGQNLVVEVAGGSYSEYCAIWDVRGAGTIRINLAPTVVWNGMFNFTNDEITIFIEGNRTGINSNDGAMINPSNVPDGVGVWVNKCKLVWVNGIRSVVTRKPSTWPNFLGITGGSTAILANSDISNYQSPISVDMVSRAYMDNCRGSNNDLAGISYSGSYLGVNGQIPANGSFAENYGGLVVKTNTVQTTSCNPALAPTFVDVTQTHTFSTISYRSIRSDWDNPGLFAQSGWSPYAPWTGYAYFSNIKSWTDGRKTGATLKGQIFLQRKSTSHGVSGPVAINLYGIRNSDGALISYGSPCSLSRGGSGGSGWFPVDSLVTDIASGYIKETVVIKGSGNSQYAILENNCQLYISTTFSVRA